MKKAWKARAAPASGSARSTAASHVRVKSERVANAAQQAEATAAAIEGPGAPGAPGASSGNAEDDAV